MVTKLGASVGKPIAHSLSPVLHNAAYAALGLTNWHYNAIEIEPECLSDFVADLGPEWIGLSVTMPLKREALALAHTASERAELVGAANTLLPRAGGWYADNTDVPGMVDALREAGVEGAERVVVLGAGGTAQAALAALTEFTTEPVRLAVRDKIRAQEALVTAQRCGMAATVEKLSELDSLLSEADLVISTLPAGVADQFASVDFRAGAVVVDVVYHPWPTVVAATAAAQGCQIVSGLDLLLHQATYQVTAMTGLSAPLTAMRYALSEYGTPQRR